MNATSARWRVWPALRWREYIERQRYSLLAIPWEHPGRLNMAEKVLAVLARGPVVGDQLPTALAQPTRPRQYPRTSAGPEHGEA
jgi:hypothetical protein